MNKNVYKNVILFITGFCLYITIEVLFRGFSFPLMGIVGGTLLIILDNVNNILSWDIEIGVYGLIGSFFATMFEFVIGNVLIVMNHAPMWDYSNMPLNYNGIICVPFSIAWMFLSVVGVMVADAINYYVFGETPQPYYNLFGKPIIHFRKRP